MAPPPPNEATEEGIEGSDDEGIAQQWEEVRMQMTSSIQNLGIRRTKQMDVLRRAIAMRGQYGEDHPMRSRVLALEAEVCGTAETQLDLFKLAIIIGELVGSVIPK